VSTLERPASSTTTSAYAGTPTAATTHLDGLDGLRALAIGAVLVFHLDPSWLPGGFLGVDVFFVVSGFLITTLLEREALTHGRIAFGRFWTRRARRLIPALVVCVVVSTVAARVAHHDLVVHIGRQILGALTFSTNWVEIAAGSSYFDQTSPQLFMNFWSLAVEEQFYLVWPLVVAAVMTATLLRGRRVAVGLGVSLGVALLSTALMALLYVPGEDATRVYYGTDTHVMGLMLGAALAFAWSSSWRTRYASVWLAVRRPVLGVALVTLAALLWLLREDSPLTYRGGLALACVATVVLVAALLPVRSATGAHPHTDSSTDSPTEVEPESRWRTLMSAEPVTWIGRRSYGIYLWHWPVIVIIGQEMRTEPGTFQYVVSAIWCVIVTIALADLSYRFVEAPIRVWGFRECGRMVWGAVRFGTSWVPRVAVGAAVALVLASLVVVVTAPTRSDTEQVIAENAAEQTAVPAPAPGPSAAPTPAAGSPAQDWSMPTGDQIDVFGDSLIATTKGAIDYYFPGVRQDAKSNRRWSDGLAAVAARGVDIRRATVLAFGTNAGVTEATVVQTLDALGPNRMVVLVNLYNPKSTWIDESNATLARVASTRPNVIVADWNAAIRANLGLLQADKVHPGIPGAHLFAKTIRSAMAELSTRHTGQPVVLKELKGP
jgi:peptidoglycan/LPS O-acetylase OafA/YrhL